MNKTFILWAKFYNTEVQGEITRIYKKGFLTEEIAKEHIPEFKEKLIEKYNGRNFLVSTIDVDSLKINVMEIEIEE